MNPPERSRLLAILTSLATLAVLALPGCGSGSSAKTPADEFPAQTSGSPESQWSHILELRKKFQESEPEDPEHSRAILLAYTDALLKTTDAILNDLGAPKDLREQAAAVHLDSLRRREEVDPQALEKMVAASERIEADNPKTGVAAIAARERVRALGRICQIAPREDWPKTYPRMAKAIIHLSGYTPPPPEAPDVLNDIAKKSEILIRDFATARSLYETLADRFPTNPVAPVSKGAVHRIDQKGKVVTDIKGPGRDGQTVSVEDFRGKLLLVDFWGTGCVPCNAEIPRIEELRKRWKGKDFAVLGICVDPVPEASMKIMAEQKLDWPQIFSPTTGPNMKAQLLLEYGLQVIPYKLVIDRDGRLVDYGVDLAEVQPTLERLMGETPSKAEPRLPTPPPVK